MTIEKSFDVPFVPLIEPHAAGRHGPEPRLLKFASLRDEAAYLTQVFAELHEDVSRARTSRLALASTSTSD